MATKQSSKILTYLTWLFILIAFLKAGYSLVHIMTTSAPDFTSYYAAAEGLFTPIGKSSPNLLPPPSDLLYMPLRLFPYPIIQGIWVVLSFVTLLWIVWYVGKSYGIRKKEEILLAISLTYLSFPSQFTLGMGQVNFFALGLVILAVMPWGKKNPLYAGILIALAILLKPELIYLLLPLLVTSQWVMVGSTVFVGLVSILLSYWIWGKDVYLLYFQRFSELGSGLGIYYNQSITGLLTRAGVSYPWLFSLAMVLLLGSSLLVIYKRHRILPDALFLFMPAFLLAEPIAWQHHFVFLIPTYVLSWKLSSTRWQKIVLVTSYFLISWNFAAPAFLATIPIGWLISSHQTMGALLILIVTLTL